MSGNDDDLRMQFAAGETEDMPPPPPTDAARLPKDMKYDSASETETDQKPDEPLQETIDRDVDAENVRAVPGTGGPDDAGDVEVSAEELNPPWRE